MCAVQQAEVVHMWLNHHKGASGCGTDARVVVVARVRNQPRRKGTCMHGQLHAQAAAYNGVG